MNSFIFWVLIFIIGISVAYHYYPNQTTTVLEKTGNISLNLTQTAYSVVKEGLNDSWNNQTINNTIS